MKTIEKEGKSMRGARVVNAKQNSQSESELKTDYPLSEKDEVKLAERKMLKSKRKVL